MRKFSIIIIIIICAVNFVFAQTDGEVLEFKSKIGFTGGEDKIVEHKFLENGKKLLIIGEKNLQIWDVENAKLLNSAAHQIPQFAPRGFVSTFLLLGVPRLLDWRPFLVDEGGRWLITVEKIGTNPLRSAVVRDLQNLKQIAVLDLPSVSTEYVSFDENKNEILTFGVTDKTGAFASWDKDKFTAKEAVSIREYKWHQKIRNDEKMIVGSGDTKVTWSALGLNGKQGDVLTLRDAKTGATEREYTAKNLKPETAYQETTISADEKFLISKRDDRVFVWEIDGSGGQPKFEISNPNPKGSFSFKEIIDRKYIIVKIDEQLRIYDIRGNGAPRLEVLQQNPKEDIDFVQIFGDRFAVVEVDSKLRLYDMRANNMPLLEIASDNPKDTVEFQGVTEDGKYIVVRDDRKVSVFEVSGGEKPVYEIIRQSEKERFPAVKFLNEKNLLMVTRVNRAEKKEPKTEFYDIASGKLVFDAAFEAGYDLKFTRDGKYLYETELGSFSVWNVAARRFYALGLETYTPSYTYDANNPNYLADSPRNTEYVAFSPDYRYILRYDGDVTAVFETETGKQLQTIFNPEKVKYDKQNRIKKSGLGKAGWVWTSNGKYVYAFDSSGIFSSKTVSFWEVKK
ncbi:MAG TPA: WD40 repeat domain-containing protein [Pyrinomonadaceae bacterium]|jgi:hypothetical protein